MKFRIGSWLVNVEPVLPEEGVSYYHKDQDPYDLIDHVVPQWVEDGNVRYAKFYKDPNSKVGMETTTVVAFNKYFKKGG
jgi:hypothetical protein